MSHLKDSFLKLAGTAILLSLVILLKPLPTQAATLPMMTVQNPFAKTAPMTEYERVTEYAEQKSLEQATTTATITSATTTPATNQQSEILELLQQLLALEAKLAQLENGQTK